MRTRFALIPVLCLLVACLGLVGCKNESVVQDDPGEKAQDAVLIPQEELPAGWSLVPSSDMPPIDKTPWWTENPQTLEAPLPEEFILFKDQPSTASKVRAAIYEKGERERVAIFALTYATEEKMKAEYKLLQREMSDGGGPMGISRNEKNTIVIMSISEEAPDREFFIKRLKAMTLAAP